MAVAPLEGGTGLGMHHREVWFRQCRPLRQKVAKDLYAGDLFAMDLLVVVLCVKETCSPWTCLGLRCRELRFLHAVSSGKQDHRPVPGDRDTKDFCTAETYSPWT